MTEPQMWMSCSCVKTWCGFFVLCCTCVVWCGVLLCGVLLWWWCFVVCCGVYTSTCTRKNVGVLLVHTETLWMYTRRWVSSKKTHVELTLAPEVHQVTAGFKTFTLLYEARTLFRRCFSDLHAIAFSFFVLSFSMTTQ